jgi:molybdate transport system permease protein
VAAAWVALALSLKVALWATAIALVLGVAVGYALARSRFRGRELVDSVLLLPLVLPPTVLGYYLLVVVGRHGWIGGVLERRFGIHLIFTWQGAVIAAAIVAFPFVCKSARAAFETVDAQYEEAASVLGLGAVAVFFRVTLPLAWRGILAGALLAFARALGEFGATLIFAGSFPRVTETAPLAIYAALDANTDAALALSACLVVVSFAVLVAVKVTTRRWMPHS